MTFFDSFECSPSGSTELLGISGKSSREGVRDESKISKKTSNTHFPSSCSTARSRTHNQKECSRKRIVNLKQLTSVADDFDPLDLLTMMGFERPPDGSDVSFAELLSTSPTPGSKPCGLSTSQRKMEMSSLLSVHAEEDETALGHSPNTPLSSSAPGHNVATVTTSGGSNTSTSKSTSNNNNNNNNNNNASQPMHIPPLLSYSPPSASSEDSIKDGMLFGSLGDKCAPFNHHLSSSSANSVFGSGQMYYPNLLDDPQLIADKQQHASSHQIYPSYIVCKFSLYLALFLLDRSNIFLN